MYSRVYIPGYYTARREQSPEPILTVTTPVILSVGSSSEAREMHRL